jgi:hypothetical protein
VSKQILFFAAFLILSSVSIAQTALVQGVVTDEFGNPLELINVTVKGYPIGTSTDSDGFYKLELSVNMPYQLVFSSITHEINDQEIMLKQGQQKQLNIKLASKSEQIQEVSIEDKQVRKSTLSRLDPRLMAELPSATGSFEAMLKTLPGVSSNNELSSQYSVRGGNYDENLVYVNDILIYRPFLIRSGEQEGMSFINSDMVSSVLFSSGGFDARYGDKMSSVLVASLDRW